MHARALLFGLLIALTPGLDAQSVDLGRGELPLHVPADYSEGTATPLVVVLHGYGGNGDGVARYMGLAKLVDSHGFLLVHPSGTEQATGRNPRFWNASRACCNFAGSEVDDVAYIKSIIDEVKSRYTVDADRVYLVGHSNGGFMSYRMAYEHPGTIAAIVSLAGAASTEELPPPAQPVHVLQVHGTADDVIEYDGGDIGQVRYPSARETVERWAAYAGCAPGGISLDEGIDLDREIEGPETEVIHYMIGCRSGGSAELWVIADGGHSPRFNDSWPTRVIEWLLAHPKS